MGFQHDLQHLDLKVIEARHEQVLGLDDLSVQQAHEHGFGKVHALVDLAHALFAESAVATDLREGVAEAVDMVDAGLAEGEKPAHEVTPAHVVKESGGGHHGAAGLGGSLGLGGAGLARLGLSGGLAAFLHGRG